MNDLAALGQSLSVWLVPVITAITLHEAAHAWVADRLGDDTARSLGRVSFNPLRHVDPFGTLVLPGMLLLLNAPFLFGWAKPVPVAFHRLRNPKRDMVWVALAGPGTNIVLAVLSALAFHFLAARLEGLTEQTASTFALGVVLPLAQMAQISVIVNIGLAIYNMLPLPPLDGGRVLTGILPYAQARLVAAIEPFGFMILIALIMTDSLGFLIDRPIAFLTRVLL
jgi:Zn-dependent protease